MSYATWQEALEALVKREGLEKSEVGRLSGRASGTGSPSLNGTVGALGPSMSDSETPDPLRNGASSTPDDGSRDFRGRLTGILSRWKEDEGDGFILMVSFDSRTAARLREKAFGLHGSHGTGAVECSLTIMDGEPPTT